MIINEGKIIYRLNIIDLVRSVRVWLSIPSFMVFLSAFLLNKYSLLFLFSACLLLVINKNEINDFLSTLHKFKQYFTYSIIGGVIFGLIAYYIKSRDYMAIGSFFIIFYMLIVLVISLDYGNELLERWKQGELKSRDKPAN